MIVGGAGLTALALVCLLLVVVSVGGAGAVLSTAHHELVGPLLGAPAFSTLFGLASAAPGPNLIFLLVVAHVVHGWAGLAVALACYAAPLVALDALVDRVGAALHRPWFLRLQRGLTPAALGLGAYGALVAARGVPALGVVGAALGAAALLRWRLSPALLVVVLAGGGALVLR